MKMDVAKGLSIMAVVVVGAVTMVACGNRCEQPGVGERTGAAMDRAAEKTVEAAKATAAATKEAAGKAVEKTGKVLETSGAAVEKTGADMQK
jgi:hypothetical protein